MKKYLLALLVFMPGLALANGVSPTSGTDGLFSVIYASTTPFSLFAPGDYSHTTDASTTYCTVSVPGNANCGVASSGSTGLWDIEDNMGGSYTYDYTASSTPDATHFKDYLFMYGVLLFFIAYPVWGRIFSKPRL